MAVFNFPASPVTGDKVVNSDSGVTYQWQASGYWKSIKYEQPIMTPPMFCFRQEGPPANDTVRLMKLVIPTGYRVDLSSFEYSLSAAPASGQDFDILVNNVRSTDQIRVSSGGVVTVVDTRGPYDGPLELDIYAELGVAIDATFGTLTVVTEMEII